MERRDGKKRGKNEEGSRKKDSHLTIVTLCCSLSDLDINTSKHHGHIFVFLSKDMLRVE